jgi:hypothetical protein
MSNGGISAHNAIGRSAHNAVGRRYLGTEARAEYHLRARASHLRTSPCTCSVRVSLISTAHICSHIVSQDLRIDEFNFPQSTSAGLGNSRSRLHSGSSKRRVEETGTKPPAGTLPFPSIAESGIGASKSSRYAPSHPEILACIVQPPSIVIVLEPTGSCVAGGKMTDASMTAEAERSASEGVCAPQFPSIPSSYHCQYSPPPLHCALIPVGSESGARVECTD